MLWLKIIHKNISRPGTEYRWQTDIIYIDKKSPYAGFVENIIKKIESVLEDSVMNKKKFLKWIKHNNEGSCLNCFYLFSDKLNGPVPIINAIK